ncbi:hypothetical protein P171DRAFT_159410 [Karstenula rhodostoma CBS 690.94]|uniref:Rhodopsin domain-containing protein n=1 Tax=Karstenula rhodostoma CBS 690.94 TaxID=1392251 RepID=A0A9P4P887_9PLEO|nr:hypothetical protein P171DRAFT_159410 [Karstenula rhodostoma CBS 690.94]
MAYDNPHGLIAAAVIVQTLVLLMIGSRFASHKMKALGFHTSDYLIIVAGILSTALGIEQVYCAANGLFSVKVAPLQKADPAAAVDFLYRLRMHNYAFVVTGILAVGFIKTSVSFFYLQIFSVPKYRPYITTWIVIMTLWTVSFFTAFMAICGDHGIFSSRSHMNPAVQKKECGSTQKLDFGVLISDTVSDLITVLIPLPMIFALQHLPLSDKISIAAILLVGLLSVGASAARSYIGIYTKFAPKDKIMDPGLGVTATCVWTLIEIQVGILAACAPTIRPVIRELVHNGLFSGLMSAASSIVSRKISRSNIQDSDHAHSQYESRLKGGADEEEIIQLHDMSGANSSSAEHVYGPEVHKNGTIHVSKGYTVDEGHR